MLPSRKTAEYSIKGGSRLRGSYRGFTGPATPVNKSTIASFFLFGSIGYQEYHYWYINLSDVKHSEHQQDVSLEMVVICLIKLSELETVSQPVHLVLSNSPSYHHPIPLRRASWC